MWLSDVDVTVSGHGYVGFALSHVNKGKGGVAVAIMGRGGTLGHTTLFFVCYILKFTNHLFLYAIVLIFVFKQI